jgi:NTP pyrophosphatase (non-canonical NTP hydrolase)
MISFAMTSFSPTERRRCSMVLRDSAMEIREFQDLMREIYGEKDRERGVTATIAWLAEELGELAQATRKGTTAQREHEAGDLFAWLASLANQIDVDLDRAVQRFSSGCPHCGHIPCAC